MANEDTNGPRAIHKGGEWVIYCGKTELISVTTEEQARAGVDRLHQLRATGSPKNGRVEFFRQQLRAATQAATQTATL